MYFSNCLQNSCFSSIEFIFNLTAFMPDLHTKNAENGYFKVKAFSVFIHLDSRSGCVLFSVMSCLIILESWT